MTRASVQKLMLGPFSQDNGFGKCMRSHHVAQWRVRFPPDRLALSRVPEESAVPRRSRCSGPGLSLDYRTKAYELRDRASEAEKYWITATYHKGSTGNIQKAIEACDLWIENYPRTEMPHLYLGAAVLPVVGQYERAAEETGEGVRLRPDDAVAYVFRIVSYRALNRFDEAKATYAQATERKLHDPFMDYVMYNLAFAQNDQAGMAQHSQSWSPCRSGNTKCWPWKAILPPTRGTLEMPANLHAAR